MEDLNSYYNSLFVVQVTVFGIAFAGLIALTQILRPLLTFKSTQRLLRSPAFLVTTVLLLVSLVLTAVASLLLSLKTHDLIPFDMHARNILQEQWFATSCLLLVAITFVGLAIVVLQETRYLIPEKALEFLHSNVSLNSVKDYFDDTYSQPPVPPIKFSLMIEDVEKESDARTEEELDAEYEKQLKEYNRKKERAGRMENPLLPLESYLMQSVRRDDLQAVSLALKTIEEVIGRGINKKTSSHLVPLIRYYSAMASNCIELADAHGLQSVVLEVIDSTDRVATKLINSKQVTAVNPLIDFWRMTADSHQNTQPDVFKRIMSAFRDAGEEMLGNKDLSTSDIKVAVENIDRCLGWLGERILEQGQPGRAPVMSMNYETEFNSLMNAVSSLGWSLAHKRPDIYPLIYFDCLYVIAAKLAPYAVDEKHDKHNRDTLFSLAYSIMTFAEHAMPVRNVRGAALALLRLEEQLKIAKEYGLEEQEKDCLNMIMELGALAADYNLNEHVDFFSKNKTIANEAIDMLKKNARHHDMSHQASELIIKFPVGSDYETIKAYLRRAGAAMGTDFGLNLED